MTLTLLVLSAETRGQDAQGSKLAKKVDLPGRMQIVPKGESLSMTLKKADLEKVPIRVISSEHNGQRLKAKPSESFVLVLHNPASGGYLVRDPEFDPQILSLQKMEKKPPSDPSREGDFGSFEWTFRAIEEGISVLIVRAFRPWEKEKPPTVIFEASIQVSR